MRDARKRIPALLGSLAALAGCSGTAGVEPSGFLDDYSQLKPGRANQAQLVYIDPEADFSPYEKVLIDPVVVWERTAGSDASGEELRSLASDLGAALRRQLQLEFDLVEGQNRICNLRAEFRLLADSMGLTHPWKSGILAR